MGNLGALRASDLVRGAGADRWGAGRFRGVRVVDSGSATRTRNPRAALGPAHGGPHRRPGGQAVFAVELVELPEEPLEDDPDDEPEEPDDPDEPEDELPESDEPEDDPFDAEDAPESDVPEEPLDESADAAVELSAFARLSLR